MRRLFSILWKVILSVTVGVFVLWLTWLAWDYARRFAESYQLVMATWVMAGFTIILAVFAILQGMATWGHLKAFRETHTWDRLRVHSEKLKPILTDWVKSTRVTPGELTLQHGGVGLPSLTMPTHTYSEALWEHMKTGCEKDAAAWIRLEREFQDHRESSKKFWNMLVNEMKRRVRLPTYSYKGKEPKEWFNSLRCAEIVYLILTGEIPAAYYFEDNAPKIETDGIGRYQMMWPRGTTIARTKNETECAVIEQAVTDLTKDREMVRQGNKLSETAQDIGKRLGNFRDQLEMLIGVIELGGILGGDCKYCRRLKLR